MRGPTLVMQSFLSLLADISPIFSLYSPSCVVSWVTFENNVVEPICQIVLLYLYIRDNISLN